MMNVGEYDDDDNEEELDDRHRPRPHQEFGTSGSRPNQKKQSVTAADAEFLEFMDTTTSADRVVDLHKSNLLRLQMDELVTETLLSMDPADPTMPSSSANGRRRHWVSIAQDHYVPQIVRILQEQVSLANVPMSWEESGDSSPSSACPFVLRSDKHHRGEWKKLSSDQRLRVQPRGCYSANIGFTKPMGNAQVLPTLDLMVLIPTKGIVENKDYMKHRYFDKRNAIIRSVAQQLSRKKHASLVGTVYWRGTLEHPTLLLIPPTEKNEHASAAVATKKKTSSNKRAKPDDMAQGTVQRTQRLRFRVELHFGMDNLDWIQPHIRLVPNRCNLGGKNSAYQSSLMYNYRLTQDASHLFMSDLECHNSRLLKEKYPHWNKVVVLAKIWLLQRGLLNRHDGLLADHVALLVLYLYRTKLAGPRMGPPQVLAALFKLLAETDWLGERGDSAKTTARSTETSIENNLIRKAPSEGYQEIVDGESTTANSSGGRTNRTVLVLPLDGKTMDQTMSEAEMAQVYEQQTTESPLTPDDPKSLLALYQTNYTLGPVFLDPSMTLNYLGRISPAYMRSLQREAQRGLDCMHLASITKPFQILFMTDARFFKRYDAYLQIPLKDFSIQSLSSSSSSSSALWGQDRVDLGDYESIARGLIRVLRAALGDRVTELHLLSTGNGCIPKAIGDGVHDSDEISSFLVSESSLESKTQGIPPKVCSPNGRVELVLGVSLNPDTCFRTVDRGPPTDSLEATQRFLNLWGKDKAELRRFKDGALVYAVVWDTGKTEGSGKPYFRFQNDDKVQGGIVERIIRHILKVHFIKKDRDITACFSLRNILSTVDGVVPDDNTTVTFNPFVAHRWAMKAFEELSKFLREESLPTVAVPGSDQLRSRLGIPLAIDAVEPLDPSLRYAQLFPPVPHPLLGGSSLPGFHKVSCAVSSNPIRIQIRFGPSSKWPTDLAAIGAAKTAMLVQLVNGIEQIQQRSGRGGTSRWFATGATCVTPDYADVCYRGYVFRIVVRADAELKFLKEIVQPSDDAVALFGALTKKHVVGSKHHSILHSVYTSHPSSSTVARVLQRWVASHLFSGLIPFEAMELLVAHVYTTKDSVCDAPGTVVTGLMRVFRLLSSHDWEAEPLIVDPNGHLSDDDHVEIKKEFDRVRGPQCNRGPAMFIVSLYDRIDRNGDDDDANGDRIPSSRATPNVYRHRLSLWRPTYTWEFPERVVLSRARRLAERSYQFMEGLLIGRSSDAASCCSSLFQESSQSFLAFSALLRVDSDLIMDQDSSSSADSDLSVRRNEKLRVWQSSYSRSMYSRYLGPKDFQIKLYKNLMAKHEQSSSSVILEWNPVQEMVRHLRQELGQFAVFWYNSLCPEVVTLLWRPNIFAPKPFSAISSEYARPVVDAQWQKDTLVTLNVSDILRELACYTKDIVIDERVFHRGMELPSIALTSGGSEEKTKKRPPPNQDSNEDDEDGIE